MVMVMITMMIARMVFSTSTGFLVSKRPAEVDGWVFLTGLSILLIQFNEQVSSDNYLSRKTIRENYLQVYDNLDRLLKQAENSFTLGNDSLDLGHLSVFRKFLRQALKPN